jgi:pimeloyl-ACP methyl ester carboxylesterase
MRRHGFFAAMVLLLVAPALGWTMTPEQRKDYLDKFIKTVPDVPTFRQWVQKSGELPPDFDALPRINSLPDPLRYLNGRPVTTPEDWIGRRAEILQLFEKYAWGAFPPHPKLDRVEVTETPGKGYRARNVILRFGPQSKGTLHVTMVVPEGKGPFPVLMGPGLVGGFMGNTNVSVLLRRGYITASYACNDGNDDSAALAALYPEYDFATLPRRAWAATMVLDCLETMPEADMKRVGIYGYSRDGKQAVIAAALDERISAVIGGSTGIGGVLPYRLAGERNAGESIETTTRAFPDWFHPRLRFFSGREDRLPMDGNLLVALIAPRACLIEYGLNDEVSNTWGNEQSYDSALKTYKLLGQPDRVGILRVPGFHGSNDMEACLDWMDFQFGRSERKWTNNLLFPWDFEQWRARSNETVDLSRMPDRRAEDILATTTGTIQSVAAWEGKAAEIRKAVEWMLGEAPPLMPLGAGRGGFGGRGMGGRGMGGRGGGRGGATGARGAGGMGGVASTTGTRLTGGAAGAMGARATGGANPGQTAPDVIAWVIARGGQSFGWLEPQKSLTASRRITFGYNVHGDLYYPANTPEGKKLPTVIWLHGYSYPLGYMWVYRQDLHPILALVKAGYAVLAYDQCGFGSRMSEIGPFYDRYPHWSQMGRLVEDVRAAIDALGQDSLVDPRRIYLFGYSLGGNVALHVAALDPRVKGVVSISGFTPWRTDTADKGTGGIARYSIERGIMPRLGFFIGQEAKIPYDYPELIGMIAPRPALVVEPQLDRDGTPADVRAAVDAAKKIYTLYGADDKLSLMEPWDYTRLPTATQDAIIKWMGESLK